VRESVTAEESDDAVTTAIERRRRTIEAEWNELGAVVLIGAAIQFRSLDAPIVSTHSWLTASTST